MTTYLGKSCSFGLPRVPFVNCRRFMYLVISLLIYRAECGIWLYQFLIIAYLFTLTMSQCLFVCLCWGLTSQSTIFQSCRDGATASWVINQYFRGVKCLAQGHNTAAVGYVTVWVNSLWKRSQILCERVTDSLHFCFAQDGKGESNSCIRTFWRWWVLLFVYSLLWKIGFCALSIWALLDFRIQFNELYNSVR